MATSPTQRTLALLRKEGYTAEVTEHWNAFARIRQDLFNVIDVLALGDGEILGVQATSYGNISARAKKIADSEHIGAIRKAGMRLEIWGWRKVGRLWQVKRVDVS